MTKIPAWAAKVLGVLVSPLFLVFLGVVTALLMTIAGLFLFPLHYAGQLLDQLLTGEAALIIFVLALASLPVIEWVDKMKRGGAEEDSEDEPE